MPIHFHKVLKIIAFVLAAVWDQAWLPLVMGTSPALQARRALVKLLITLSSLYAVVVNLHRDPVLKNGGHASGK